MERAAIFAVFRTLAFVAPNIVFLSPDSEFFKKKRSVVTLKKRVTFEGLLEYENFQS